MPDLYGTMRRSERRNARVTITPVAPATTLTLISAVCTLYDSTGTVAGGVSGAVAQFDTGALAAPQVWYLIEPSVLAITTGNYTLAFFVVDSAGNEWEPVIAVVVKADGS